MDRRDQVRVIGVDCRNQVRVIRVDCRDEVIVIVFREVDCTKHARVNEE